MGAKKAKRYLNMKQLLEEKVPWSQKTLERRILNDGFPAIKDVKGFIFDEEDVDLWMKKRKVNLG